MGETAPASILLHSPGAGRCRAAGHSGALSFHSSDFIPRLAPFPGLAADRRAEPEFRPDSSLFELLPRTQTGRSQLSWTGQVRRDLRGTGEGVSSDRSFLGFFITPRMEIFLLIDKGSPDS